ncbi:MAG: cytochrome c biogenesis protein CcdA [Muribaculaceae bacterium]|nr:cytochrome c biogenesis protein CcdA [Muribaculaceae bacterium]MDY3933292.1 cytochrome c biogenesis protein CcdA [Muribaculaceae bacterium]
MRYLISLLLAAASLVMCAQQDDIKTPITWDNSFEMVSDTEAVASFTATIDNGWHLYSTQLPDGGPSPTVVVWDKISGLEPTGDLTPDHAPIEKVDEMFELTLSWWEQKVTLTQHFKVTDPSTVHLEGYVEYSSCNDETCIPPTKEPFTFSGNASAATTDNASEQDAANAQLSAASELPATWTPVDTSGAEDSQSGSLWYIFLGGFLGGLLALLTPCVWPMIPLTVSFFLKKSGSRAKSILNASVYGLSIIIIYLLLGLIITLAFGASALNELSTNAVFNVFFFLMLVVFAISFFGAFDITLPSSWSNHIDSRAGNTTGFLSIFFMAFTLTLVSFSCTGPIIGTLLVEAATMGNMTGPAVGMFGFALALAIPFSLFSLFPSMLKEMPKSGGWLNSVKVVLGFIELALSLKFLSVADLTYHWHILDREVFVSLWIVIFFLLGIYLLGKLRFSHDSETKTIGTFRFFLAMISLAFSVYLLPGLWGAPLKAISAFAPPLTTQDFNLYEGGKFIEFDNYDEALSYADEHSMPVFVDFSGFGCTNCRKMETAVFENSEVEKLIQENFVMVKLMVDDRKPLAQPMNVVENGKKLTLTTVGERWSYLQRYKFAANSQPYYVVVNSKGDMLSGPYSYNEDIEKFLNFLQKGVDEFNK